MTFLFSIVTSTAIGRSDSFNYCEVVINQTMSWSENIGIISTKINERIGMIKEYDIFCLYMLG